MQADLPCFTMRKKMTKDLGGAKIYIKREDLNHTGSHKINNVLGQALLAQKMGKKRLIAETGSRSARSCNRYGSCSVWYGMRSLYGRRRYGTSSIKRIRYEFTWRKSNWRKSGTRTLKDAVNEAMRDWTANVENTYYLIGSAMGPHPYPTMVRDFQKLLVRKQNAN